MGHKQLEIIVPTSVAKEYQDDDKDAEMWRTKPIGGGQRERSSRKIAAQRLMSGSCDANEVS